jgi:hypothetical protein
MDARAADEALLLDAQWIDALREAWLALMEAAVWADIRGARPGLAGRARKRALEAGERLRSLTASRDWIPKPRERLKNALASALSAEEALAAAAQEARELQGPDAARLEGALAKLESILGERLPALKARWAALLDAA